MPVKCLTCQTVYPHVEAFWEGDTCRDTGHAFGTLDELDGPGTRRYEPVEPDGRDRTVDPTPGMIRHLRTAAGVTQRELGDRLGVGHGTIHRWEHGEATPSSANRRALARLLGRFAEAYVPNAAGGGVAGP